MKTIQTKPDCTLEFWNVISETIPYDLDKCINLSKITEEQAKELVERISDIQNKSYGPLPANAVFCTNHNGDKFTVKAVHALQSAAISVGIKEEEFENYLVIKL